MKRTNRRRFLRHALTAGASGVAAPWLLAGCAKESASTAQVPAPTASGASGAGKIRLGFIPLTDCASVVMAHELGLFRKHGVDVEVSKELAKAFRKLGVDVLTSTRVDAIDDSGDTVKVTVTGLGAGGDGQQQTLQADKVLQAIGFQPRVDGYGLDKTGVKLTDRGAIEVDGFLRTSVPHIFAIGDVNAKLMLAHAAESMGVIAAETIAGAETMELDYVMIPRATFCQPQIASFGYTEAQARDMGYDVKVAKFPFTANGKAHGLGDPTGFVKLISDATYGELLGGHLIGPEVTELLPELTLAQQWDLTTKELARNVHAHPTLSEALKEALHGLEGHMINF